MRKLLVLTVAAVIVGCWGASCGVSKCDMPYSCVSSCDDQSYIEAECSGCPSGTIPNTQCLSDAGVPDAGK